MQYIQDYKMKCGYFSNLAKGTIFFNYQNSVLKLISLLKDIRTAKIRYQRILNFEK